MGTKNIAVNNHIRRGENFSEHKTELAAKI